MSSLRSALDELRVEDVRRMRSDELESRLLELQRASDVLLAERARTIAEADHRAVYRRDGYVSTKAWLADRARVSFSSAKRDVATALALAQMPVAREAPAGGEIT